MTTQLVILGAGGFAREMLDLIDDCIAAGEPYEMLGYLVDKQFGAPGIMVNDKPILGGLEWLAGNVERVQVVAGVGPSHLRYQFVQRALAYNARFATLIHPNVVFNRRWLTIGQGTVITAGCILTNNVRLGNFVQLNLATTIGHDAVLGDYATTAPGVHISGFVELGEGAYLGTGVNVIDRTQIGAWSIVGAGSTVVKSIAANVTAVGSPARAIKERAAGWHTQN